MNNLTIHAFFNEENGRFAVSFWNNADQNKLSVTAWLSPADFEKLKQEIAGAEKQALQHASEV